MREGGGWWGRRLGRREINVGSGVCVGVRVVLCTRRCGGLETATQCAVVRIISMECCEHRVRAGVRFAWAGAVGSAGRGTKEKCGGDIAGSRGRCTEGIVALQKVEREQRGGQQKSKKRGKKDSHGH